MSEESIFREVDEEVRQEQLQKLWDKYGIYLIAACLGVIAAVSGIKGWQAWQKSQSETAGGRYLEAIDLLNEESTDEARVVLDELANDGPDGYALLARIQAADVLTRSGDTAAALVLLDEIAANAGSDDLLGQLAIIKSAMITVETVTLSEVEARLGSLATDEGPWLNSAREVVALSAYLSDDYERADRIYLDILSDASTPTGIQGRARRMQDLIEPHLQAMADPTDGTQESPDN